MFPRGEGCLSGKDNSAIKILEVGCGSGANLWMLAKEGMDNSPTSLQLAKDYLHTNWNVTADLRLGSFDKMPYEDSMFDYVIDVVSMECIDLATTEKALKEVRRVLKPNGKFFSYRLSDHSVMYECHGNERIDAATVSDIVSGMPLAGNGEMTFWSPSLSRVMYEKAGLRIISIERRSRCYANALHNVEYLAIVGEKNKVLLDYGSV